MAEISTSAIEDYNPSYFGGPGREEDPDLFRHVNPVGTVAPDFPATRLNDLAQVKLSDYLGKGYVVLEFGSVT